MSSQQSHELGRIDLSNDDSVAFIETDESEDDLSDHSARVVTREQRAAQQQKDHQRRRRASKDFTRSKSPPDRKRNMSSNSASRRFRRTSIAKPPAAVASSSLSPTRSANNINVDMWKAREDTQVDQSVNLMDVQTNATLPYDSEMGSTRGSARIPRAASGFGRPGMTSAARQKSMVDVFLADDGPQTRGGNTDKDSFNKNRGRKCMNFLIIVIPLMLVGALILSLPSIGLVGGGGSDDKDNNNNNNNPAPAPAPAPKPQKEQVKKTPSPTGSPTAKPTGKPTEAPKQEKGKEEEAAPPPPAEEEAKEEPEKEEEEEKELNLQNVPQDSRVDAFQFFLTGESITDEAQLKLAGSAPNRAMHWITEEDDFQLEIPGLDEVATNNKEAERALLQRYALATFYYSMTNNPAQNSGRQRQLQQQQQQQRGTRMLRELSADDAEHQANRALFDSTWLSGEHTCMWHGVTCDKDFESILEIKLSGHFLEGTIPKELLLERAMPALKKLNLSINQLGGTLPDGASSTKLHVLELADNRLTGSMDNLVMGFPNINKVDLSRNQFSGKIPDKIKDLSKLVGLRLNNNKLNGAVPAKSLAKLTRLKFLRLSSNSFTGDIPEELHTLTSLRELKLTANKFNGGIPSSYGDLTNLELLHMDGNSINGKVPPQLGQLTKLTELQLDGNNLTGDVPEEVCKLREGSLNRFETDCADGDIKCECCSDCF